VRLSTSELAEEIYELLLDDSEAENSLSSSVSSVPQIEQQLSTIPFRSKENIPMALNVFTVFYGNTLLPHFTSNSSQVYLDTFPI
jgi:hypothetical protein